MKKSTIQATFLDKEVCFPKFMWQLLLGDFHSASEGVPCSVGFGLARELQNCCFPAPACRDPAAGMEIPSSPPSRTGSCWRPLSPSASPPSFAFAWLRWRGRQSELSVQPLEMEEGSRNQAPSGYKALREIPPWQKSRHRCVRGSSAPVGVPSAAPPLPGSTAQICRSIRRCSDQLNGMIN